MADLKRLYVELATNVRPLAAGLGQASLQVKKFGKDVLSAGADLDVLAAKAAASAKRVQEAQLRLIAAQERLNTLRASGKASAQQQASAEASLIAAERALTSATKAAADAQAAATSGSVDLAAAGAETSNVLETVATITGGSLVAGLTAAAVAALALEQRLYNVASISPDVAAHMDHYRELLVTLSTELPQSANELADGFYNIVSSGFAADAAVTVLEASARAAAAGLTSTETAAAAITGVLNSYGLDASHAADVSDVLFSTVKDGVISFEELAQGVGEYIGTGAAAKVSVGELGAAIAAMTLSGVSAAESGTSLNTVLQSLIAPSDAMAAKLQALGYESGAQALEVDSLHGVMEKLRASTGGNVTELLALFPQIRAARGAFALMAAGGANYQHAFDDVATVNGRVGSTLEALAEQQKAGSYQITILKNQAVALGITMGQTLLPIIKFVVGGMGDFLQMIQALPAPIIAVVTVALALAAAVSLGGAAFLRFREPIANFRSSLAQMRAQGSALPAVLRGAAIAAGALTAAMVIGTLWYGHYAREKEKARQVTQDFTAALKAEATGQKDALQAQVIKDLTEKNAATLKQLQLQKANVGEVVNALVAGGKAWDDYLNRGRKPDSEGTLRGPGGLNTDPGNGQSLQAEANLEKLARSYEVARGAIVLTQQAQDATTGAMSAAKGPLQELDQELVKNAQGTVELTAAQKGLRDGLLSMVDASGAAKTALTSLTDPSKVLSKVQQDANTAAQKGNEDRRAVLADLNEREKRAAQDRVAAVRNGTKAEHQAAADNLRMVQRHNKDRVAAFDKGATDVQVSLQQWTRGLKTAAVEQSAWQQDLTIVARRAGVDVADALRAMGADAAPLVHQLATGTKKDIDDVKTSLASLAPSATVSLQAFTDELTKQVRDQAAFVGNLVVLAARGHSAIADQLKAMPIDQAAPLAAKAAAASQKALAPLEAILKQRAGIIGDGTAEALAKAVEDGMAIVALAADKGAKDTVDALVQRFGGVDEARLYLVGLKAAITDVAGRHQIDLILNVIGPATLPLTLPQRHVAYDRDGGPPSSKASSPPASAGRTKGIGGIPKFAGGGRIDGPGSGTSDDILAAVSRGEWVVRESSARSVGAAAMHHINTTGTLPPASVAVGSGGGVVHLATQDIERVALALSRLLPRVHKTEFSGPIQGLTLEQVRREAEKAQRVNSLGGQG